MDTNIHIISVHNSYIQEDFNRTIAHLNSAVQIEENTKILAIQDVVSPSGIQNRESINSSDNERHRLGKEKESIESKGESDKSVIVEDILNTSICILNEIEQCSADTDVTLVKKNENDHFNVLSLNDVVGRRSVSKSQLPVACESQDDYSYDTPTTSSSYHEGESIPESSAPKRPSRSSLEVMSIPELLRLCKLYRNLVMESANSADVSTLQDINECLSKRIRPVKSHVSQAQMLTETKDLPILSQISSIPSNVVSDSEMSKQEENIYCQHPESIPSIPSPQNSQITKEFAFKSKSFPDVDISLNACILSSFSPTLVETSKKERTSWVSSKYLDVNDVITDDDDCDRRFQGTILKAVKMAQIVPACLKFEPEINEDTVSIGKIQYVSRMSDDSMVIEEETQHSESDNILSSLALRPLRLSFKRESKKDVYVKRRKTN